MTHPRIMFVQADARRLPLADESVHCVVTSPPYFNLRDYSTAGQIGLEETPSEYVKAIVGVFHEVRRVLREDGVAWLNLGDSYAGSWGAQSRGEFTPGTLEGASSREHCLSARQILAHPKGTKTGSRERFPGLVPRSARIGAGRSAEGSDNARPGELPTGRGRDCRRGEG